MLPFSSRVLMVMVLLMFGFSLYFSKRRTALYLDRIIIRLQKIGKLNGK